MNKLQQTLDRVYYSPLLSDEIGVSRLALIETKPGSRVYGIPGRKKVYSRDEAVQVAKKLAKGLGYDPDIVK